MAAAAVAPSTWCHLRKSRKRFVSGNRRGTFKRHVRSKQMSHVMSWQSHGYRCKCIVWSRFYHISKLALSQLLSSLNQVEFEFVLCLLLIPLSGTPAAPLCWPAFILLTFRDKYSNWHSLSFSCLYCTRYLIIFHP